MKQRLVSLKMSLLTIIVLSNMATMIALGADDAQINLLNKGCSQYNATNVNDFYVNLNETFSDLRTTISNGSKFATAQHARSSNPAYGMVQCRNYLSTSDCVACFDAAEAQIRKCSAANGARVIYDGCFLRYESNSFFDQTTLAGNVAVCGNRTASSGATFSTASNGLLTDIVDATPKIDGYFAASSREVGSAGGAIVYSVAQCVNTVSETGCRDCLTVAYNNIQSCPPNAEGRAVDAGCFLRYSDTAFFDANQTIDLSLFLSKGSSSHKGAIIGGIVGGVVFLLFAIMFVVWLHFFRRNPKRASRGDILGATELRGPMNFDYKVLSYGTKNFSEENKLGEGGFGEVYKGILKHGKVVAIKKLTIGQSSRAKADFESEIKLISNVHHRNLIRLLGCCSKSHELLLVYEYMANGSLDKFIFGDKQGYLNWKQRFDIILGAARGLAYLHEEFHACIIHRDIKSSNILLDDDFQPKIADFGLARLLPEDQTHLSTKFAGTLGYTAPEYAIHGQLSVKVDTYSYGVVVLEIISGRKCNDITLEPVAQYLLEWAWTLYEEDRLMDLVDKRLDLSEYRDEDVKKVIEIALLCTQSSVVSRPTMSEVVVLLLSRGSSQYTPSRPIFIDVTKRAHGDKSTSTSSSTSNANLSITQTSGR